MIRKLTLLFVALIGMHLNASAQLCGFDQLHAQLMANDPAYAQKVSQNTVAWAQMIQNNPNALTVTTPQGTVYEIPVVIHVMNTGGAIGSIYNPTDAQLQGMITYLNQSYASTYAAYPDSLSGGTYIPIRFKLAVRDPLCNSTTGITRDNLGSVAAYVNNGVNSNLNGNIGGLDDTTLKNYDRWPPMDYYNIWVVNRIDGANGTTGTFIAGFAYFAGAGPKYDGTIMLATQAVAGQITLPHEVGHAMGLYHVFQGDGTGNTCPTNTNCATQGDQVCDTEPEKRSVFNCPSNPNPCTGLSYNNTQHNFMDYSSCQDRFTQGQRTKMLFNLHYYREGLISSLGATPLPATAMTTAACSPAIINAANTFDAGPRLVVLNDMSAATNGGYNSDGNQVYLDRTCRQGANLVAGQTYSVSVLTGANPEKVRVYMDYNNDGAFTGANELIYSHDGTGFNETHTGSFTVPATGITTCTAIRMRVVSDRSTAASPTSCGPLSYGQAEDYSVFISGASNSASVSIALAPGYSNPSCINTTLSFIATPTGNPAAATYKWYVNGVYTGVTGTTYTASTFTNGNVVTAKLFYSGGCGADSSTSNSITLIRSANVAPAVTIAVTGGSNPGCAGQTLTFTATATNGGTAPVYQWRVNGIAVPGATSATFTTGTLANGDVVSAVLTSNLPCATTPTATSNNINISFSSLTASATISITAGSNPTCGGKPVTFTVNAVNGGTNPTYLWLVNGASAGASGTTFTTSALQNGDSVRLLLISNSPCVTNQSVLSNAIRMTVIPSDTPKVSIAITSGNNPGCLDSLVQLTATATNSGTTPIYAWYLNGVKVANGNVYNNTSFVTGDVVYARVIASGGNICHFVDTAYSASITLTRFTTPKAPLISLIGNLLVADSPRVQWYGPSGLIPGATSQTYHPTIPGPYYAVALNNGCDSRPSNTLLVSVLSISSYNLSEVQIFPNPTTGQLVVDWGIHPANGFVSVYSPSGQHLIHLPVINATRKVLDLSSLANGVYFVVLQDEQGKSGTVRITVMR